MSNQPPVIISCTLEGPIRSCTSVVMFLVETPGYQALENGVLLPEAGDELKALAR